MRSGFQWGPVAAPGRRAGREVLAWRADALDRCDAILLGPNGYDLPPPAIASALRACIGRDEPVTGASVDIRAITCGR